MYLERLSQSFHFSILSKLLKVISLWALMSLTLLAYNNKNIISDWNETAHQVMFRVPTPPRSPLLDMAYVHIAIFDAVNAIDGKYTAFAIDPPNAFPGANEENAAAAAARFVLRALYPADSLFIDSVYYTRIFLEPTPPNLRGIQIGEKTAELFMDSRKNDRSAMIISYTWQAPGLGVYQTTPPGSPQYQPVGTTSTQMQPFSFSLPSKFRAPAPPPFNSDIYTRDFNEVKKFGSLDSSFSTPEQREIARFHTENPNIQVIRNIRNFVKSRGLSLESSARLYAQIYAGVADALICAFESKYYYNYWRPVTAIRQADIDGNPNTIQDAAWLPLVATPRHPEYPAAHGITQGALAYTIKHYFGTSEIPLTLTSTVTGTTHNFTNTNDFLEEIIDARVCGGMHFRTSVEEGIEIGRKVAEWISETKFQRRHGNENKQARNSAPGSLINSVLAFSLEQNYPNPFNPSTNISYSLPTTAFVNLTVYNILGKEVAVLVNEQKDAGRYKIEFNAAHLPSGIYIYKLKAGQFEQMRKLILMK